MRAKKPSAPKLLPSTERRTHADRRQDTDRREMPRPEGRRRNGGRRVTDPSDA